MLNSQLHGQVLVEAQQEVNSDSYISFSCNIHMTPAPGDYEAEQMYVAEVQRLLQIANSNAASSERACLPGAGPISSLPAIPVPHKG